MPAAKNRFCLVTLAITRILLVVWIALTLAPVLAVADDCTDGGNCFRPRGCPLCRGSFLLEISLAQSSEHCGEGGWFGGEFGYLWNLGPKYGLGAKFFMAGDDCGERNGIRLVGRRWLNSQMSFEIGPGIALGGTEEQTFPAFSLQVALEMWGVVAPVYNLEMIRPGLPSGWEWAPGAEPETRWESFLGVRASSYAVPVALVALLVAVGASGGVMGGG